MRLSRSQNIPISATRALPAITILIIGIAYALLSLDMPLTGDDLYFANRMSDLRATWKGIPVVFNLHFTEVNSRFGDMLTILLLHYASAPVLAIFTGISTALFFLCSMIAATRRDEPPLIKMLFLALLAFAMRWDTIWMEFCTLSNCVWSTGFAIAVVILLTTHRIKKDSPWLWLSMPFCLLAGWMHEATGLSLLAGIICYLLLSDFLKNASPARKWMLVALIAGCAVHLFSPTLYNKIGTTVEREPIWQLILLSGVFPVLAAITAIFTAIKRPEIFGTLLRSRWTIFFAASLAGELILCFSGYGGRPGWAVQTFGCIALFINISAVKPKISNRWGVPAAWGVALIIVMHYVEVVRWQHRLAAETRTAISMLKNSDNGVIFLDYTQDQDTPWWLLRKTHGVPDDDDIWYRTRMSQNYAGGNGVAILPMAARSIDFSKLHGNRRIGSFIITDEPLPGRIVLHRNISIDSLLPIQMEVEIDGVKYVEIPFVMQNRHLYYYAPIDYDNG